MKIQQAWRVLILEFYDVTCKPAIAQGLSCADLASLGPYQKDLQQYSPCTALALG